MSRALYVRIVGASGFAALAALFVVIDPFLSVGASLSNQTPAVSVNRSLKGDRLSINPTVVDVSDGHADMRASTWRRVRKSRSLAMRPSVSSACPRPLLPRRTSIAAAWPKGRSLRAASGA